MDRHLKEEEKEKVVNFGAISFHNSGMAKVLGWTEKEIESAMKGGEFKELYEKGEAVADYLLNVKLFEMAKSGDIKALEKYQFLRNQRKMKK